MRLNGDDTVASVGLVSETVVEELAEEDEAEASESAEK
jgi:hypothetical protein